jgi:histidyl-tRNA synthetase
MASDKKNKIKARLPRGFADRGPSELAATREMLEKIRAVYERYGFDAVETPAIEYTETLGKFLPDQDRPNEGVFSFQDDDEQWLSLRYDLTAPLARYVAENFQNLALPYRSYRYGWVFRNEKPGPGRFRQFMQFDADTVGAASVAADAEMCMLAADTLEALGIKRGDYLIKVNSRKIYDGMMEEMGLEGDENAERRLIILRAIDKRDRLGDEGVRALLGKGRKDESGDFTKGAGLLDTTINALLMFVALEQIFPYSLTGRGSDPSGDDNYWIDASTLPFRDPVPKGARVYFDNEQLLNHWDKLFTTSKTGSEAISELRQIVSVARAAGYGSQRIRIDPSVVRGLEYYTGPVYEAELTFEVKDEKGNPVRFGSVAGGGRYDDLVARFTGQPVPATGFSIGVSRLMAALRHLGKIDSRPARGPVLVTVFRDGSIADYQKLVAALRNADIRAELYLGSRNHNLGQQLKYADRRGSPCAVIQGGDEKASGKVLVRDLVAGADIAKLEQSAREDYLKKQAEAQFSVPEGDLVKAVKEVLARHGIG